MLETNAWSVGEVTFAPADLTNKLLAKKEHKHAWEGGFGATAKIGWCASRANDVRAKLACLSALKTNAKWEIVAVFRVRKTNTSDACETPRAVFPGAKKRLVRLAQLVRRELAKTCVDPVRHCAENHASTYRQAPNIVVLATTLVRRGKAVTQESVQHNAHPQIKTVPIQNLLHCVSIKRPTRSIVEPATRRAKQTKHVCLESVKDLNAKREKKNAAESAWMFARTPSTVVSAVRPVQLDKAA